MSATRIAAILIAKSAAPTPSTPAGDRYGACRTENTVSYRVHN
jgi:hypothetical protein